MYINNCDRMVVFRGKNGVEFLSMSRQKSTETTIYNGTQYPLVHLECTVGQWHIDSSGTSAVNENKEYQEPKYYSKRTAKLRNRDRKRLCDETPIAEFS